MSRTSTNSNAIAIARTRMNAVRPVADVLCSLHGQSDDLVWAFAAKQVQTQFAGVTREGAHRG